MTLISITHPSVRSAPIETPAARLSLSASGAGQDPDRFSLNSNLSTNGSPSPHSSLTSPYSANPLCVGSYESADAHFRPSSAESRTSSPLEAPLVDSGPLPAAIVRTPFKSTACLVAEQVALSCGDHSSASSPGQPQSPKSPLSPASLSPTDRLPGPVRRLSRIEHRQSLSDLGYGKVESYTRLQRLGKGTYATVYMGRSRLSNDLVALKEILKEHDEGAPCTAIREVSLLRLLRHTNIVTLHDICHTPKKLTLVFEYVGPDLYAYMKENNHLLSIHNVRVSMECEK